MPTPRRLQQEVQWSPWGRLCVTCLPLFPSSLPPTSQTAAQHTFIRTIRIWNLRVECSGSRRLFPTHEACTGSCANAVFSNTVLVTPCQRKSCATDHVWDVAGDHREEGLGCIKLWGCSHLNAARLGMVSVHTAVAKGISSAMLMSVPVAHPASDSEGTVTCRPTKASWLRSSQESVLREASARRAAVRNTGHINSLRSHRTLHTPTIPKDTPSQSLVSSTLDTAQPTLGLGGTLVAAPPNTLLPASRQDAPPAVAPAEQPASPLRSAPSQRGGSPPVAPVRSVVDVCRHRLAVAVGRLSSASLPPAGPCSIRPDSCTLATSSLWTSVRAQEQPPPPC